MEIHFQNVSYEYGAGTPFSHLAIKNVTLTIPSGQFVALMGKTGSGKTTLAQMVNGLIRPTRGEVQVGEYRITAKKQNLTPLRSRIGYAFQYPEHQLFEETVFQDIAFSLKQYEYPEEKIPLKVRQAMERVGLSYEEFKDRSPFQLSGGQMRKVALAGVLVIHPKILILDEPTAGLDPKGRLDLLTRISELHREERITILLITHHLEEALEYGERILFLREGELFADLKPKEVYRERKRLFTAGILPSPLLRFQERLEELRGMGEISWPHREAEMMDLLIRQMKGEGSWIV
ncbi:Energy-coupling factor transporter ATP-binding protein EcfA 2 [[Clostridium] ultunense Esp]|uniref:ATP-binding cassette domain-containing protein n=1 Tax=Thermicanus aegyptius TaxID=94009 RepID=UPI0002B6FE75|nr:ATP-binding cassette domain-containing protein [Thermicanus aegyptius]CCQ93721.1 Energy-coupling factor transporter ATP-binding protein EcfA 2 [[Clostridium] ultunense Esp]